MRCHSADFQSGSRYRSALSKFCYIAKVTFSKVSSLYSVRSPLATLSSSSFNMVSPLQTVTTAALLVVMTSHLASATFDPVTAIDCYVHTGMKHVAEKSGCDSSVINVRGCWGRCDSYQVPSLLTKLFDVSHPMCTPASYKNITVTLENCAPGIDPTFTYVEATTCGCRKIRGTAVHYGYRPDYFLP